MGSEQFVYYLWRLLIKTYYCFYNKNKIDKSSTLLQFVKQDTDVGRSKQFIPPCTGQKWPVQHTHDAEHMQDVGNFISQNNV